MKNTGFISLIEERSSRRSYREGELPEELLAQIRLVLAECSEGPFGNRIEFHLIDREDLSRQKIKLGTYGFIQGARFFIAGSVKAGVPGFLDYGYALERIILEMTRLGLGTCWLGGTFDRSEFSRAINLPVDRCIPAVTPVGFSTAVRGIGDQIIRLSAGSAKRLPWSNLFFNHDTGHPLSLKDAGPLAPLFEAVRLAPSASNKQPWRIFYEGKACHFSLIRTPGYRNKFLTADLQMVDIGIAMAHWDLAAQESGIPSKWVTDRPPDFPAEPEYIVTALFE